MDTSDVQRPTGGRVIPENAVLKGLAIRFDGPPGHESGRFVEVEIDGKSVNVGRWIQQGDYWLLHLPGVTETDNLCSHEGVPCRHCGTEK